MGSCGIVRAGSLAPLTGSAKWNEAAINVICHKLDFSLQLARAFQNFFLSLSGLKNGLRGNKKNTPKTNPTQHGAVAKEPQVELLREHIFLHRFTRL